MTKETMIKRITREIESCKIKVADAKTRLEQTKIIAKEEEDWDEWVQIDEERLDKWEAHLSRLIKILEEVENGTSELLSLCD